eukprot:evm.model.NODE_29647_length_52634_cov_57.405155.9
MLRTTLATLEDDMPAKAVKLGMLATAEVVGEVGDFLAQKAAMGSLGPVVCDPVMVTTSGSVLLDEDARKMMIDRVFPHATLITPNKHEAEVLVGYPLRTPQDVERAACDLLAMGKSRAVLVKGGHSLDSDEEKRKAEEEEAFDATVAQDYLLERNRTQGMWITSPRLQNPNTHGTGCTLSSAVAAFLAQDLPLEDAVVLAKAYVSQGIRTAIQLGHGPGPVQQTGWPASPPDFPWVSFRAEEGSDAKRSGPFAACEREIGLYACVDSAAWVQRLLDLGVRDIQLRIKNRPAGELDREVGEAAESCRKAQARLWVNDYWKLALRHQTYGLHIGQEDLEGLLTAPDQPLTAIQRGGVRLGISTHTFAELGRAVALRPSYISLGPIFPTASKKVNFGPQGLARLKQWRHLVDVPLVAIGGIGLEAVPAVQKAGADGICVISALTKASDLAEAVKKWQEVCGTSN